MERKGPRKVQPGAAENEEGRPFRHREGTGEPLARLQEQVRRLQPSGATLLAPAAKETTLQKPFSVKLSALIAQGDLGPGREGLVSKSLINRARGEALSTFQALPHGG